MKKIRLVIFCWKYKVFDIITVERRNVSEEMPEEYYGNTYVENVNSNWPKVIFWMEQLLRNMICSTSAFHGIFLLWYRKVTAFSFYSMQLF